MLTLIQKIAHLCLKPLIALFDFPIVPAELTTLVNKLFEYIQAGTGILNFLCRLMLSARPLMSFWRFGRLSMLTSLFCGCSGRCRFLA